MKKDCKQCGVQIVKVTKLSIRQWERKKFCSQPCQWKGKDMSNFVPPLRGKKNPNCAGPKSHLWKGGVTKTNDKIRRSFAYKDWRRQVFERDDYTCQFCGIHGGDLQADHIKPFALFEELRFDINNGRTLCKPCHRKTPTYGIQLTRESYLETL